MSELSEALVVLTDKVREFSNVMDIDTKSAVIVNLEEKMAKSGFWDDQESAQQVIGDLKVAKDVVVPYKELLDSVVACGELLELAEEDGDEASQDEIREEMKRLDQDYDRLEIRLAMSGPYDRSDVYLSIQAGAGGTESCDWAAMLMRMYVNYCQKSGYKVDTVEISSGEEAGIKSCTLAISGDMAYGYFKSEMGTHRLVRMSPFNAQGKRQTSFVAVEVTPELPDNADVKVDDFDERDFRIDTYRASGAGGQHINKTDSAVRLTHLATGVVASCQSERSQSQNRTKAWKMMAAKLQQLQDAERLEELQALQGERGTIGWGHQIRSYVLQPTQLITDLRSRLKEGNASAVLDGDIQPFIDGYLRWRLQNSSS